MAYSNDREVLTATVSSGGSTSAAIPLGGKTPVGLVLPATFDALTARIMFDVSDDGTTYSTLKEPDGTVVSITVADTNTNKIPYLEPWKFAHALFIKLRTYQSDESTAQSQTAGRACKLVVAKITG